MRLALFLALLAASCVPPPPAIGPLACSDGSRLCGVDDDCGIGAETFCSSGCCARSDLCLNDDDCGRAGTFCNTRRGLCELSSECFDTSASSECADGERCLFDFGRFFCTDVTPGADNCVVANDGAVARSGEPVRMAALATDADGAPVAFGDVTWGADAGAFDGDALTASCASEPFCEVRVTATTVSGGATCEGNVRVYPALPDGSMRVIVVDAAGAPLDTRVDARIDGAFVSVTTVSGSVTLDGAATIVSAFPDGHEWHSIIDPPRDVVIVAAPLRDRATVIGAKGTVSFDEIHTQGDIKLAFTGLALPSLIEVTREDVLGVTMATPVELEGVINGVVDYPSPLTMELGDNPIKGDWYALGDASLLWTIGGQVPLAEIGPALAGDAGFASLVRAALPFLARADHGIASIEVSGGVRPGDNAPFAEWPLAEVVAVPSVVPVAERALDVSATEPDLISVALARVPGLGFVPLGIGDATALSFAPPHSGLEGNDVLVAAVALDLADIDAVRASFAPLGDAQPPFLSHLEGTFDGVAFASTNDPGADTYRVRFEGWTVSGSAPLSFAIDELHAGDVVFLPENPRAEAIAGTLDDVRAISSQPIR